MKRSVLGRSLGALAIVVVGIGLPSTSASAASCKVVDGPSTYGTLQAAVSAASPGAKLHVSGTCTGPTEIDKSMSLIGKSTSQQKVPTLDGQHLGPVLTVDSKVRLTVDGLKITRGSGATAEEPGGDPESVGGGIFVDGGNVTLSGSTNIVQNQADAGKAIAYTADTNTQALLALNEDDPNLDWGTVTVAQAKAAGFTWAGSLVVKGHAAVHGGVEMWGQLMPSIIPAAVSLQGGSVDSLDIPNGPYSDAFALVPTEGPRTITGGSHGSISGGGFVMSGGSVQKAVGSTFTTYGDFVVNGGAVASLVNGTANGGVIGALSTGLINSGVTIADGRANVTVNSGGELKTYHQEAVALTVNAGALVDTIVGGSVGNTFQLNVDGRVKHAIHQGASACPWSVSGTGRIGKLDLNLDDAQNPPQPVYLSGNVHVQTANDHVGPQQFYDVFNQQYVTLDALIINDSATVTHYHPLY